MVELSFLNSKRANNFIFSRRGSGCFLLRTNITPLWNRCLALPLVTISSFLSVSLSLPRQLGPSLRESTLDRYSRPLPYRVSFPKLRIRIFKISQITNISRVFQNLARRYCIILRPIELTKRIIFRSILQPNIIFDNFRSRQTERVWRTSVIFRIGISSAV